MTSQRIIVGTAGALFLILRMDDLSQPLVQGPGGAIGWLLFGCQFAIWIAVAVQHALMTARTVPTHTASGTNPIPCARLLDLTITASFGLLLWATMFAPWTFFIPLLAMYWLLVRHRTARLAGLAVATVPASIR
ncbi:MAG: hypothetical protein JW846_10570 [Dehalococcoidia bacterium]|nr:hypothetical protein [Dehalococcoidia bacterium]